MKNGNFLSVLFVVTLVFLVMARGGDHQGDLPEIVDEVRETSLPFVITDQPAMASVIAAFDASAPVVLAKYLWKEESLAEKNINQRWAMASLTKLMSAVVAKENLNPDGAIIIDKESWAADGTAGGFLPGENFLVSDLIKAMLVVSSNDAAEALARSYDQKEFVSMMRRKAEQLGMFDTYYADTTGLSSLNQSTAADLEKLVRYIYSQYPEFFEISREREVEITELKSKIKRKLVNINKFTAEDYFIGGKTGFTEEAGGNLISLFRHQNQPLLIMIFGAEDRFAETQKVYDWINLIR